MFYIPFIDLIPIAVAESAECSLDKICAGELILRLVLSREMLGAQRCGKAMGPFWVAMAWNMSNL